MVIVISGLIRSLHKNVVVLSLAALVGASAWAGPSVSAGTSLFQANRWRGSLYVGSGQGMGETYIVAGLGLGYFLATGLELGVDGEAWLGADPKIYKITPGLRYVYTGLSRIYPYVGAFYRRTIYSGFDDLDSYGGRFGVYTQLSGNAYAGFGGVYEKRVDCDDRIDDSCASTYPEISLSLAF